jgi:cysteine desulfurase
VTRIRLGGSDARPYIARPMKPLTYLDNNATTRVLPEVLDAMLPFLTEEYGNPSSPYRLGSRAERALDRAREQVAALVGADPAEIVFTSGGTESNNAAVESAILAFPSRRHVITTGVEHSAILQHVEALARRGYEITRLPVGRDGRIDPATLALAIRDDTALVTVMWANNETGVISPIAELAEICRARGVLFHTDAVQAVAKVEVNLSSLPGVNYLSLSGHKFHAPKGVGALFVRSGAPFTNYFHGGGQQADRRAGTENTASIVALGRAAELAAAGLAEGGSVSIEAKRDRLEQSLLAQVPGLEVNGTAPRVPNTTNLYFPNLESGSLLLLLDKENLAASAGSACLSGSVHPSHVLAAMGFSTERARASARFSLSRLTTDEDVDHALEIVPRAISRLRAATADGPVLASR